MPKTKRRRPTARHLKRHGKHQKHTKHFINTYWPYLPLAVSIVVALVISNYWQPKYSLNQGVLAYATNTTQNGLLTETNQERTAAGKKNLSLNSKLNQAAQAKANDMASRDYWSHNTPEGNPPWDFIDDTGYSYQKAGENLAYGFLTSATTVSGWMNSPPHKANMLDGDFTEVGFGYANSNNYQDSGQQTIVVAMYALPTGSSPPPPPPPPAAASKPSPSPPAPAPEPEAEAEPETETAPEDTENAESNEAITLPVEETPANIANTTQPVIVDSPQTIARVQALTSGRAPWSVAAASLISVAGAMLMLVKHGFAFRRVIIEGERFIVHHPILDSLVLSIGILTYVLTRTAVTIL